MTMRATRSLGAKNVDLQWMQRGYESLNRLIQKGIYWFLHRDIVACELVAEHGREVAIGRPPWNSVGTLRWQ